MKNENKLDEMAIIMECLQKDVPYAEDVQNHNDELLIVTHFHQILVGGDQLTVAHARGAQRMQQSDESGVMRLEGMTLEDPIPNVVVTTGVTYIWV